jgi:predicted AAA+ superfamily ATPase
MELVHALAMKNHTHELPETYLTLTKALVIRGPRRVGETTISQNYLVILSFRLG